MTDKVYDKVFIANDGTEFTKAKDCRMYDDIQRHAQRSGAYTFYGGISDIERLKCRANVNDKNRIEPTFENVRDCHWLPLAEVLCQKAREQYISALNESGRIDSLARVSKIFQASRVYEYALRRRNELIDKLRELKAKVKKAKLEVYAAKMLKKSVNGCKAYN